MASHAQLSALPAFQPQHQSSSSPPQSKTLALHLPPPSSYLLHISSPRTALHSSHRCPRSIFTRSTVSRTPSVISSSITKLSDTELFSIPEARFPTGAGIYGVFDKEGDLQFIGISRDVAASISAHSKMVPQLCHSVKKDGSPRPTKKFAGRPPGRTESGKFALLHLRSATASLPCFLFWRKNAGTSLKKTSYSELVHSLMVLVQISEEI